MPPIEDRDRASRLQRNRSTPIEHGQNDEVVLRTENLTAYYGKFKAVAGVTMSIPKNQITAFIGFYRTCYAK